MAKDYEDAADQMLGVLKGCATPSLALSVFLAKCSNAWPPNPDDHEWQFVAAIGKWYMTMIREVNKKPSE